MIQFSRITPYWFGQKIVPDAEIVNNTSSDRISILLANVLIENRESKKFIEIIEEYNPDLLLVMEVDQWWVEELQILKKQFPHYMEYPLDNAYGMALYSRFSLQEKKIEFFQHKDVPSFHTKVELPSKKQFFFHGVHPVAPIPSGKYPDNVGRKEVSLLKTAEKVANDTLPSIVAGDFNDVSWSNTSRLFEDTGNLRNVRIGRGLYNSFNANSRFMRWPLDHYFVTQEFSLLTLERLPTFGSDHFPMFGEFIIEDNL